MPKEAAFLLFLCNSNPIPNIHGDIDRLTIAGRNERPKKSIASCMASYNITHNKY